MRGCEYQAVSVWFLDSAEKHTHTHTSFKNIFTHLCSEYYLVTYETRGILLYNGDGVLPGMESYRGTNNSLTLLKTKYLSAILVTGKSVFN
jgi:hypothetical protein